MMSNSQTIANRYTIENLDNNLIGQGAMGEVYLGMDALTGEKVAIKVLKADALRRDPNLIVRFQREGEALRQLNHPNIVKMLDALAEGDTHYLIMEYVGGGSLQDLLSSPETLPLTRVLEITLDLADALTRAHRLQIIHRDLKPANILLAEDGTPRLTDFGIAYMVDQTRLTQTGMIMGTIAYISPEACAGQPPDERSDIWSLGIILYEMLIRRHPFAGNSITEMLVAIVNQPVPDITQINPHLPLALVDLIGQMLEKDPQRRLRNVRHVGSAIDSILRSLQEGLLRAEMTPSFQSGSSPFQRSHATNASFSTNPLQGGPTTGYPQNHLDKTHATPVSDKPIPPTLIPTSNVTPETASLSFNRRYRMVGMILFVLLLGGGGLFALFGLRNDEEAPKPLGQVIGVVSQVELQSGGRPKLEAATLGMLIYPGDTLIMEEDASMIVACRNGVVLELPAESTTTLRGCSEDDPQFLWKASNDVLGSLLQDVDFVERDENEIRADYEDFPILLEPRNSFITDPSPTFVWQAVENATDYQITLLWSDGEWETITDDTMITYPNDAENLPIDEPITVLVQVWGEEQQDISFIQLLEVSSEEDLLKDLGEIQVANLDEIGRHYLLAQRYREEEMWADAIAEITFLLEEGGEHSPHLYNQLGDVYYVSELYLLAEESYTMALDLAEEQGDGWGQAQATTGLARIAVVFGEVDEAYDYYGTARDLYGVLGEVDQVERIDDEVEKVE